MRKRSDPFKWTVACYLVVLATFIIAKLWIALAAAVLVPVIGIFVYSWLVFSHWPRKRLIDQAEKHKPDEYPVRYEEDTYVCQSCGAEVEIGRKFCGRCGYPK